MTITLASLTNATRPYKRRKVVGRGLGSKRGQTSGRGQKGMGARSGYKTRHGYVGGGVPLHKRVPTRGFSNVRFARKFTTINLGQIDALYVDGETVSLATLREKGFVKGPSHGIKVLAGGALTKQLSFQVDALSKKVHEKLNASTTL